MKTQKLVIYSFFAALSVILSQISIPLPFSPIPINLTLLSIFLCAGILDTYGSFISQIIYLALGAIGLPVFANFSGGIGILFGPRGGFLLSYPIISIIIGVIVKKFGKKFYVLNLSMLAGLFVCYLLGTLYFSYITNTLFVTSIALCVIPFIAIDIVKIILASLIILKLNGKLPYSLS